jgi:hypothetical protein
MISKGKEFNTQSAKDTETARETKSFAEPAIENRWVGVNSAIAQKGPIAASVFAFCRIAFNNENFFLFAAGLRDDLAERIGDKRISPEFDAGIARGGISFITDAIDDGHESSIGYGV